MLALLELQCMERTDSWIIFFVVEQSYLLNPSLISIVREKNLNTIVLVYMFHYRIYLFIDKF